MGRKTDRTLHQKTEEALIELMKSAVDNKLVSEDDLAAQMGVSEVMLVDEQGVVYLTPAMHRRIRLEQEVVKLVVAGPGTE